MSSSTVEAGREAELHEVVLEAVYGVPFDVIDAERERLVRCDSQDLRLQGEQILRDLVRLARGEISSIHIPRRLARLTEYNEVV